MAGEIEKERERMREDGRENETGRESESGRSVIVNVEEEGDLCKSGEELKMGSCRGIAICWM